MTAQDYKNNGYKISLHIDQAEIDAKEDLAFKCYVLPIIPTADREDENVRNVIMAITFVMLAQGYIFATRAGGKQKNTAQSSTPNDFAILNEGASRALAYLEILKTQEGAVAKPNVIDVAHLFLKTQFFYI